MSIKNNPGEGAEFEVLFPALLAIKLCYNEDVEDFKLHSNDPDFGKFDDLVVEIAFKNGETKKFAFQMKHKENETESLNCLQFENKTGDFSLPNYFESYKKIKKKEGFHCFLYTNKNFWPEKINECKKFQMSVNEQCPGLDYFYMNTKTTNKAIYKFEVLGVDPELENFFNNFSLYTNQLNASEIETELRKIFKEKFSSEDKVDGYVRLFRDWHLKNFPKKWTLNKDMVKYKLFDLFLMPHVLQFEEDDKSAIIQEAFENFDISVCENVDRTKTNLKSPNFEKFYDKVEFCKSMISSKIPVIILFDNKFNQSIYETIHLFKDNLKFVLFGESIDMTKFAQFRILKNLSDLREENKPLLEKIADIIQVSLQGRNPISLHILSQTLDNSNLLEFLSLKEFLESDILNIGENKEYLLNYILRKLEKSILLTTSINKIARDSFVIDCGGNQNFLEEIAECLRSTTSATLQKKIYYGEISVSELPENAVLLLKKCTIEDFYFRISNLKKENFHYLRAVDSKKLEWITTKGSIERLHQGDFDKKKIIIEETEIDNRFKKSINIICARPGMGKSTIMKSIKNQTSNDFWTVKINLIEHNQFFKTVPSLDQVFDKFLKLPLKNSLEKKVLEEFLKLNKIMWFFDGVDEMRAASVDNVVECVKMLISKGHNIWISSRYSHQKLLENNFNVLAVDIEELSKLDQRNYIRERLKDKYEEKIVDKLHRNATIRDNSHILGIPLQLYMLTEILLASEATLDEDIFILTKMYHHFFRAKLKHYREKSGSTLHQYFDAILETYTAWALRSFLEPELFNSLNLICDKIVEEQGIMVKLNDDEVVFDHKTHADYLIAVWLSKNFEKISLEDRFFIFEDRFENMRFLFDMVLVEDIPVILATLSKDFGTLEKQDSFDVKDRFGRSALHICCSYGTKYPRVELDDCFGVKNVKRSQDLYALRVDPEHKKVLELLLTKPFNLLDKDNLFNYDTFQYADRTKSLYSLAELSKRHYYDLDCLKFYNDTLTILYYSVFKYFPSLLKIINKEECRKIVNTKIRTVAEEGTFLHLATKKGHLEIVKLLLENGADINMTDGELRTPIIVAAGEKQFEILQHLLQFTSISLPVATFLGFDHVIDKFLAANVDVDKEDLCFGGGTALFAAAFIGNLPLLKRFVEAGANYNWKNQHGYNALHVAAERGYLEMVQYLVELGVNPELLTDFGNTALQLAVKQNHIEIVKQLLEMNVNIRIIDILGQSILDLSQSEEMSKLLNETIDQIDKVSLHWSSHQGQVNVIKAHLATTKNDINNVDGLGRTALHMAAKNGYQKIVNMLIEYGACVNIPDEVGNTPLHLAAEYGYGDIVQLLLEAGADVKHVNKSGRTPKDMTYNSEILEKLEIERKNSILDNLDNFHRAAALGDLKSLKELLEQEGNNYLSSIDNYYGQNALHWAIREGHSDVVNFLIKKKINLEVKNKSGHTALYLAIRNGNYSSVKDMIDALEVVDEIYENGNTALHIAAIHNAPLAIEEILKTGVNINLTNADGKTPLHFAAARRHKEVLKLLLEREADREAFDEDGLKPLDFAFGNNEVMEMLKF